MQNNLNKTCKLAVFVSGGGTNLQAIINNIENKILDASIAIVISDQQDAKGLERANNHEIDNFFINPKDFESKYDYETALISTLSAYNVDLIILAGYMRVLSSHFVNHFENQILNIHPSLLPKYKGLNTHQKVLDNDESQHGTTVHVVTAKLDDGPIIIQESIDIMPDDNSASLQNKIQNIEYRIYSQAITKYWAQLNQ